MENGEGSRGIMLVTEHLNFVENLVNHVEQRRSGEWRRQCVKLPNAISLTCHGSSGGHYNIVIFLSFFIISFVSPQTVHLLGNFN